ncbi:MAG TPA: chain-length determining protein, partial [Myxococcaceae bacterium]|nr:chain-length determining protein [Myxococcaceae bacterium]
MSAPREELPEVERAQAQLVDWEQLKDYAGFIKRAVLRHKVLVINTFMVTALLGALAAKFLPRSYYSQATLLPKRSSTIAALVNPDRAHTLDPDPPNPLRPPGEVDSVTLSASRAVMRRENLVALVKRVNLLDRWEATRAPLLRVKDAVMRTLSGRPPEDVKLDAMVGILEKQLSVSTDDGRVTIGILWPDPQLAYELVEAAQLGFLEATEREQLATINDALEILTEREKVAAENVKTSFLHFEKVFSDIMTERRRVVGDPRVGGFNPDQQMAELRFLIRAKRRAISDAQEQHNRRLEQMQAQLVEKRKLYGPEHPERVELEQRVTALRAQESPQTRVLLQEEKELLEEYAGLGGKGVPFPDEPMPDPYGLERVLLGILPSVSENPKAAV